MGLNIIYFNKFKKSFNLKNRKYDIVEHLSYSRKKKYIAWGK